MLYHLMPQILTHITTNKQTNNNKKNQCWQWCGDKKLSGQVESRKMGILGVVKLQWWSGCAFYDWNPIRNIFVTMMLKNYFIKRNKDKESQLGDPLYCWLWDITKLSPESSSRIGLSMPLPAHSVWCLKRVHVILINIESISLHCSISFWYFYNVEITFNLHFASSKSWPFFLQDCNFVMFMQFCWCLF